MYNLEVLEPDTDTRAANNHGAQITQTREGTLIGADEPEFFAPTSTGALDALLAEYRQTRSHVETVAEFMGGPDMLAAAGFFFIASREQFGRAVPNVDRVFEPDEAIKALDAHYWDRALDLTDVRDYMPAARRKEWHEQIETRSTPAFTERTVKATMASLLAQRLQFLAEQVDGLFRGLSGEHVTNRPEGFSKRMIIDYVFSDSYGLITLGHKADLIHDLRGVIARFMGRDQPGYRTTPTSLRYFRGWPGEWHDMDGGALRVRVYKKGTAHLEVHPDIAWQLNKVLAFLYPTAIPPRHRQKPTKTSNTKKSFRLLERPIPFAILDPLCDVRIDCDDTGWLIRVGHHDWSNTDKHSNHELRRVMEAIGGVGEAAGIFRFDYNPRDAIGELVAVGALPDERSHQYFPTPEHLAAEAVSLAEIGPTDCCLEPSAGQGALARHMPTERTTCVEVSRLHCSVLRAKGYETEQADFLNWSPRGAFDAICMNPPFSEGRAKAHLEHAAALLAPGGRLVAVLPVSMVGQDVLPEMNLSWSSVYNNEFAGASVSVVILKATRPAV